MLYSIPPLTFRTIDPVRDADLCVANHYDACLASFGHARGYEGRESYLRWLADKVAEFPEGFVLAFRRERFVGQLELQVPYGSPAGYVNLFYVSPDLRSRGYGQKLHQYAERYFRSWEADRIELHVSPRNLRAIRFYRKLGYAFTNATDGRRTKSGDLWKMSKLVADGVPTLDGR